MLATVLLSRSSLKTNSSTEAAQILNDFVKGFVMDDERLKNPPVGSSVLERIRDIHASMRRVYLQVICPPADSQPTVSPLR